MRHEKQGQKKPQVPPGPQTPKGTPPKTPQGR